MHRPRGGFSVPGVDSASQGWIQRLRGGFSVPGVDASSQGWFQHPRGGFSVPGVDSAYQGWIQRLRDGFSVPGVDASSQWWIQSLRGGFSVPGVDSASQGWIQRPRGGFSVPGVDSASRGVSGVDSASQGQIRRLRGGFIVSSADFDDWLQAWADTGECVWRPLVPLLQTHGINHNPAAEVPSAIPAKVRSWGSQAGGQGRCYTGRCFIYEGPEIGKGLWGVERTLAVIGIGGPVKRSCIVYEGAKKDGAEASGVVGGRGERVQGTGGQGGGNGGGGNLEGGGGEARARATGCGGGVPPVPLVLPDLRYIAHQLTHMPPILPVVPKTRGNTASRLFLSTTTVRLKRALRLLHAGRLQSNRSLRRV
eukprot:1188504-Prorocentrum_minimum.AAC.1